MRARFSTFALLAGTPKLVTADLGEHCNPLALLGFSLEQVVSMATVAPAKIINRAPKIGTLQIGAPGDVAIMELVEGPVSFVDTRNNKRDGKALLKPFQTVINGVPFGRPYQAPFAVR